MDNQNNIFNNMIQPNAIPEVKDSSPLMQGNVGVNNVINGNVSQGNDVLGFELPQTNVAGSNVLGNALQTDNSFVQSNVAPVSNNNFIEPSISPEVVSNNNSFIQPNVDATVNNAVNPVNNNSLNLGLPTSGVIENPVNNNTNNNLGMVVNSDANVNMGQSMLQPVDDSIKINGDINKGNSAIKNDSNEGVVSVKKYLIHMLLCTIPVAGIIILIVRAINGNDKNITNLARAQLILTAVITLLSVVLTFVMSSLIVSMFTGFY